MTAAGRILMLGAVAFATLEMCYVARSFGYPVTVAGVLIGILHGACVAACFRN